jgi:hypothetical protein
MFRLARYQMGRYGMVLMKRTGLYMLFSGT